MVHKHGPVLQLAVVICLAGVLSALGATAAAAMSFTPPVDYDVGGRPADIASADVNSDGRLDIVASAGGGIAILSGRAQGRFAPVARIALAHRPGALALADVNGDGAVDVVTANSDDTVTVLLGDGLGSFVASGTFPTGRAPADVVVGDVTGDGHADVATADPGGDGLSILQGDGSGGLLPPLDLPVGLRCTRLLCADFDLDGTMDLAYSRYSWEEYAGFGVLLADGAGGFTPMGTYETGGGDSGPHGLALGDLNDDLEPDIAVLQGYEGGEVFAFLGDGLGLFVRANRTVFRTDMASANGLAIADLDRDGYEDVVTSAYRPGYTTSSGGRAVTVPPGPTRIYVLLRHANDGVFFQTTSFLAGRSLGELIAADFNGDRRPDLAWTDAKSSTVSVRMNGALPVLTGVAPAQGWIGDSITLTGKHLGVRGAVQFGGKTAAAGALWSPTRIKITVPRGTPKGRVKVTVTTVVGQSAARSFTRL